MKTMWAIVGTLAAGVVFAPALCAQETYSILDPAPAAQTAPELQKGAELRVTISNTTLRDAPRPFGAKAVKTLGLGDTVVFQRSASGAWCEVEHKGVSGFLPQKSLIEAKKFSSFSKTSSVSDSDLAAATKGFSPEIEKRNKKNAKLRYDLMDKAEAVSHVAEPAKATKAFRREGALGEFRAEAQ